MGGLRLSEKYGVNPSVMQCFFCGEDYGVALLGRIDKKPAPGEPGEKDIEAPRRICLGGLCDRCQKIRDEGGVFLIEVRPEDCGQENPRRTGRMWVLRKDAIRKIFQPDELAEDVIEKGVAYVEAGLLDMIGVPSEESDPSE
jgi:hypothetical protein